ncbi:hypothetical protein F5879DRAFT_995040 [Lentinula edodes]|nr:hypothetical protein F5879DRAFT_995040 [Lentinula edodes]
MSSPSKSVRPSLPSPIACSSSPVPHEEGGVPSTEDEEDVDQLAFTLDSPLRPQLELFEKAFNTGKPLAGYSSDDPLWPLLSSLVVPCTNCLKVPHTCIVPPGSPQCSNCSSKKTCSLGKVLRFHYFARKCNQDLAYSRRFLEVHGTPAQKASWTILVDLWRQYNALLHAHTSSTTALMELNMLDDSDALDRDHQELSQFLDTQRQETVAASKRKYASSPVRPGGATSNEAPAKTSHKRHWQLSPPSSLPSIVPRMVHLVLTSRRSPPSLPPVSSTTTLPRPPHTPVMDVDADPLTLELKWFLIRQIMLLENSALTSALRDTSHSLEARQREVEQLRTSQRKVTQQGLEYSRVLEQFHALERTLPGRPGQTLVEWLRDLQEELLSAQEVKEVAEDCRSASAHRNSELQASIVQHQGLVDESNALAARQRQCIETLQEEVHRFRDRPAFLERMVREFLEEGFYKVSLPLVSELEGELTRVREDLRRVATFAHCLYCSSPGSALQHHNRHLGGLIEAMIALLRQGLDSMDPDVIVRNFQLVLDLHYFFDNAADRDDGLYRLVLDNSRFPDDSPFATIAQHAGYAPPFESTLEPPLHRHIFALDTALPYHGAGRWEDTVPAFPSLDRFTRNWEELMVAYVHHLSDIPLPEPPAHADIAVGDETVVSPPVSRPVPLFLSELPSPTFPSPPIPLLFSPLFSAPWPLSLLILLAMMTTTYMSPWRRREESM